MIQLVYLSFATLKLKANAEKEIDQILAEAVKHNSSVGITGELIYRNGIFLQLLEGKKEDVEMLMGKIILDNKRHENITILFKQKMLERIFPDWSMAYVKVDDAALDLVNSIVPWQKIISTSSEDLVPANDVLKVFAELRYKSS